MPTTDQFQGAVYVGDAATYAGSSTFTEFAQVTGITPPGLGEADDVDTTHLKSEGQFKEYKAGWADGGEFTFSQQLLPDGTNYTAANALYRVTRGYRVLFEDDTTAGTHAGGVGVAAYIKNISTPEVPGDGIVTFDVTLKVTGQPVIIAPDTTPA